MTEGQREPTERWFPLALIDPNVVTRHEIPHEPGEWMEIRPLTAGSVRGQNFSADHGTVAFEAMALAIVAWSYPAPVNSENIARLDMETFNWVNNVAKRASGLRSDPEKNASSASLSPTSEQDVAPSQPSSGT